MLFNKSIAGLLAAMSLVPLLVPSASASSPCSLHHKKVVHTSFIRRPATRTRTIYKTSFVPMLHTVYRTSFVPMQHTVYRTSYVPAPTQTSTVVTRETRFVPAEAMIAPRTTVIRSSELMPDSFYSPMVSSNRVIRRTITTTPIVEAPIVTTSPYVIDSSPIILQEREHRHRLGALNPLNWY